jgi:tight adherence protein C
MFAEFAARVNDPQFMFSLLVAVAAAATVLTVAMQFLEGDSLGKRMKAVSVERERIRSREREKLTSKQTKANLRQESGAMMRQVVERLSLSSWLGTEQAKLQLSQAGYRGQKAEQSFLVGRLVLPILCFILINPPDYPPMIRVGMAVFGAYAGIKAPEIFLKNKTSKRQESIRRAYPDALDLLLICVESGMSIEHAFRKVAGEIGTASVALAEEFTLTTAELSYLQDRRVAYENLGLRVGLDCVKQIVTVLIQSERYGTPLGNALRVVSQESRDMRLMEAEKKAAALPPKLTVPMIIFFLPCLFAVILTPAFIQIGGK